MLNLRSAKQNAVRLQRILAWLFLAFVGLLVVRFLLGYVVDFEPVVNRAPRMPALASVSFELKNYRFDCANNLSQLELQAGQVAQSLPAGMLASLDVFTREAKIGATSTAFEQDVQRILQAVSQNQSEVRLEVSRGIRPYRYFSIVLRVPVDRFDDCAQQLQRVGELKTFAVTKEDKSEEVRQRFAKRDALQKHLEALTKLREREGRVSEFSGLEQQIQAVQEQLQTMNVALGEFVKKESFSNINYSLTEQAPLLVDRQDHPIAAQALEAIAWTVKWYLLALALFLGLLAIYGALRVVAVKAV